MTCKVLRLRVPFISVWDGRVEIESAATVDAHTGKITDIETRSLRLQYFVIIKSNTIKRLVKRLFYYPSDTLYCMIT